MSGFNSQAFRFSVVAAMLIFSGPALAQARLQQIADEAALTAVQVLAMGGLPAEAAAAAEQKVAATSTRAMQVSASPADLAVTVRISDKDTAATAVSTARYVPPDQPATWSWASRQRFAWKPQPDVVGSFCVRDCEPNSLR
jgi:Flp pilus assembly protein TadG